MSIQNLAPLLVVGESTGTILLESVDDFRCAINRMAQQTVHTVRIYTQELDHELYDQVEFLKIASAICRQRKNCNMQILLKNPDKAARLGHRLVELQKRLPSSIEIRAIAAEYDDNSEEFFLVDDIALVKRFAIGYMRGHCEFRSIPDAVKKSRYFTEIWQRSEPCLELRRLSL